MLRFRNYTIPASSPIVFYNSISQSGYTSLAPTITIESNSKLLVVAITSQFSNRTGGAPVVNGVTMTAGVAGASEIWYIINPSAGAKTISIPNSGGTYINCTAMQYNCDGAIYAYSGGAASSSTSAIISQTVPINNGKYVLAVDASSIRMYNSNRVYFISSTHTSVSSGVVGGLYGWEVQNSTFLASSSSITMTCLLQNALNIYPAHFSFYSN